MLESLRNRSQAKAVVVLGFFSLTGARHLWLRAYGLGQSLREQDVQIWLQTFVLNPKLGRLATKHPGSVRDEPLHHANRARSRRP